MGITLNSHHRWHLSHQHAHDSSLVLANATARDAPTLVQRSSSSSSTCKAGDNSGTCQKPTTAGNSSTIIIAVAVAVPCVVAAIVLFLLHRRVKRKHRQEDRDDKYKSLDFGLDPVSSKAGGAKGGKGRPEMTATDLEKSTRDIMRGDRGLSMDMSNPYLLPAAVQSSSSSLHSMSRSMQDSADPYRPVTMVRSDSESVFSANRPARPGNASTYTRDSEPSNDNLNAGLLSNAQRMSTSDPFAAESPDSIRSHDFPAPARQNSPPAPPPPPAHVPTSFAASAAPRAKAAPPALSMPDPDVFHVTPPSPPAHNNPPVPPTHVTRPSPPAHQQQPAVAAARYSLDGPAQDALQAASPDMRRVSVMGLRPLPPDDPNDNPEQRANRIRSFYKEYFDDSRPNPAGHYQNEYEADIYADYADYMYDAPPAPFAEPMGRRAMTPPPRVGGGRVRSNTSFGSTGHIGNPAFRRGPPQPPKKKLPPPIALHTLPTPHAMTDDMAFTPIDFAPPVSFRDRQAGRRPESPSLPYSPSVRAFTPLATSFDDLSALPSAHALRKSSTFTALDFAPPPRFRNESGPASDAGSIRSNRSGISNMQQNAIRAGAYRVSRLPADMVGTQDDLHTALKPTWGLRG